MSDWITVIDEHGREADLNPEGIVAVEYRTDDDFWATIFTAATRHVPLPTPGDVPLFAPHQFTLKGDHARAFRRALRRPRPLSGTLALTDIHGVTIYLNLAHVASVEVTALATGPLGQDRGLRAQATVTMAGGADKLTFRGRDALVLQQELRRQVGLSTQEQPR